MDILTTLLIAIAEDTLTNSAFALGTVADVNILSILRKTCWPSDSTQRPICNAAVSQCANHETRHGFAPALMRWKKPAKGWRIHSRRQPVKRNGNGMKQLRTLPIPKASEKARRKNTRLRRGFAKHPLPCGAGFGKRPL